MLSGVYFMWVLNWHGDMLMICKLGKWKRFLPHYGNNIRKVWKHNVLRQHLNFLVHKLKCQFLNCELMIGVGVIYPFYWMWHGVKENFKCHLVTLKDHFAMHKVIGPCLKMMWCYVTRHGFGQLISFVHSNHKKQFHKNHEDGQGLQWLSLIVVETWD
jgi:hypothetical protein